MKRFPLFLLFTLLTLSTVPAQADIIDDTIGNIANSDGIIKIINGFNGLLSVVNKFTGATGSMNNIAAILGGIAGSQGLGLTNYVTYHSLQVPYYKIA